jgi:hypothetical protein
VDAARQVIRWSIPGTLYFLTLLFGQEVAAIAFGVHPDLTQEAAGSDATFVLALIGAAVAVGFLIYQLYHVLLEEAFGWLPPFKVPLDRGRQILQRLSSQQRAWIETHSGVDDLDWVPLPKVIRPWDIADVLEVSRDHRPLPPHLQTLGPHELYVHLRHQNWRGVKWALFNATPPEGAAILRREYTGFADIYHAIGACRLALTGAFLTLGAYDAYIYRGLWIHHLRETGGALSVWSVSLAIAFWTLTKARHHTLESIQDLLSDNLRVLADD